MNYPPVLTKRDFSQRYQGGEFGNAAPTWHSLAEFNLDPLVSTSSLYHLRNRTAGGITHYNQQYWHLLDLWYGKSNPEAWYCSEMAPTSETIIQGEICQLERPGLYLHYSTVAKPMREALRESSHDAYGVRVNYLLEPLCPNSREWLNVLLERYPNHVIEFSTYARKWGTLPNFNTVFWEVRLY